MTRTTPAEGGTVTTLRRPPIRQATLVEHRGWEALTPEQLGEDCARPGGYAGGASVRGSTEILDALTAAAEA